MRFFIALEIPSENLAQFQAIQAKLHTLIPQAGLTDLDKIHLTLAFLGEQPDQLKDKLVQIIQKPYAENKLKAEAWFRSLGFEDLCSLKISWWADRDVLPPEPTDKDFSTTGCSQT